MGYYTLKVNDFPSLHVAEEDDDCDYLEQWTLSDFSPTEIEDRSPEPTCHCERCSRERRDRKYLERLSGKEEESVMPVYRVRHGEDGIVLDEDLPLLRGESVQPLVTHRAEVVQEREARIQEEILERQRARERVKAERALVREAKEQRRQEQRQERQAMREEAKRLKAERLRLGARSAKELMLLEKRRLRANRTEARLKAMAEVFKDAPVLLRCKVCGWSYRDECSNCKKIARERGIKERAEQRRLKREHREQVQREKKERARQQEWARRNGMLPPRPKQIRLKKPLSRKDEQRHLVRIAAQHGTSSLAYRSALRSVLLRRARA